MQVATYPAYDRTTKAQWKYGAQDTGATGDYVGLNGTTDARWNVASIQLQGFQPGVYQLDTLNAYLVLTAHANCDAVRFAIFASDDDGTTADIVTLSNGNTYVDCTADNTDSDTAKLLTSDLGSTITFTIESGKLYYVVLLLHRPAGGANNSCGYRTMSAGAGPQGGMFKEEVAGALTAMPTTLSTAGTGSQPKMGLTFSSAIRKVCVLPAYAGDAVDYLIPRRTADAVYYWVKFTEAVVADGQALTSVFGRENNGAESTLATMVLDMGATDQVTFGGANVALAADEAGDTFHLATQWYNRTSTGDTSDLFYTNITTAQGPEKAGGFDFATFCHGTKNAGTRATPYAVTAPPNQIYLSGTAAVASIEIGWEPIILFGDSQASYQASTGPLAVAMPNAFEYPRIYWPSGVPGGRISATVTNNHTSGIQRYKNDTPGLGDICDMRGTLFCWCGFGVNDSAIITASSPADEISRINVAMQVAGAIQTILTDVATNGHKMLIIGLPPYSHPVNATARKAQYIKNQFNPMLEGLAMAARASYFNPWYIMCAGDQAADIPTFASAFTQDGTHYSDAGAAIVAPAAARAYQGSFIGAWWSNPARRIARKLGFLVP